MTDFGRLFPVELSVAGFRMTRRKFVTVAALGSCAVVLIWSRLVNLSQPFAGDEARTVLSFVNRGPHTILLSPFEPNNHPLFSLSAWAVTSALGRYEAAYRLASVVPGLAAIALIGWWTRRRLGRVACLASITLATVSEVQLRLSAEARGYGLAFLAGAGALVYADRASRRGRNADVATLTAFGLVGMWTLPTFALPFAAHLGVLLLNPKLRRVVLILGAVLGVVTLAFYIPHASSTRSVISGRLTTTRFSTEWFRAPFSHLAQPSLRALLVGPGSLEPLPALVFVALVVLGLMRLWRTDDRILALNLVVPLVVTYLVFFFGRAVVLPRAGSFLLFHVIVLLGVGATEAWSIARRHDLWREATVVVMGVMLAIGFFHVRRLTLEMARTGTDLRAVGTVVRGTGIARVGADAAGPVIRYYSGTAVMTLDDANGVRIFACSATPPLVFIEHLPLPPHVAGCLKTRHAMRVNTPQYVIWIEPGPPKR